MSGAVLTRETMLIGVAAFAFWQFAHVDGSFVTRFRRVLPFAVPVVALADVGRRAPRRLGAWPTGSSETRLTLPGVGLVDSIAHQPSAGLVLGASSRSCSSRSRHRVARRDPLTWIVLTYGLFATTFSA